MSDTAIIYTIAVAIYVTTLILGAVIITAIWVGTETLIRNHQRKNNQ